MLNDQLGDDILSPDHAHVLDEGRVVDVPDTELLYVWIHDRGGVEDKCAGHCENSKVRLTTACSRSEKHK